MTFTVNIADCEQLVAEAQELLNKFHAKVKQIQEYEFVVQEVKESISYQKELDEFRQTLNAQVTQTPEEIAKMREFLLENLQKWSVYANNIANADKMETKLKFLSEREIYEIPIIYSMLNP